MKIPKPVMMLIAATLTQFLLQSPALCGTGVDKTFSIYVPHGKDPVTITKKWGFPKKIASSAMITNTCGQMINCTGIKLITVGNLAYVTADFKENRDKETRVTGRFAVELEEPKSPEDKASAMAASTGSDSDEGVLAYPQKLCQGLTTKGSCWEKPNCTGTKLSNGPQSCYTCWQNAVSKSFRSDKSNICYSPFDK